MIDVPDNITAPVIGPKNFRKYCAPLYNELAEMLADVGTLVYVHMDGDLKPLWKLIGAVPETHCKASGVSKRARSAPSSLSSRGAKVLPAPGKEPNSSWSG